MEGCPAAFPWAFPEEGRIVVTKQVLSLLSTRWGVTEGDGHRMERVKTASCPEKQMDGCAGGLKTQNL